MPIQTRHHSCILGLSEFGIPAWTCTFASVWEHCGIIPGSFMCHLGNIFTCLLNILYEFVSYGLNKASTTSMNLGIGSFCCYGYHRHIVSCKSPVTLFSSTWFSSILSPRPAQKMDGMGGYVCSNAYNIRLCGILVYTDSVFYIGT